MSAGQESTTLPDQGEEIPEDAFSTAWGALFGIRPMQVMFPDRELNARVYTLDGDAGYRVQHKVVGGTSDEGRAGMLDDTHKVSFPAKNINKARQGESHGRARLKKEDIISIRAWAAALANEGITPSWTAKAAELNVSEGTLRDIVARRTWAHIQP